MLERFGWNHHVHVSLLASTFPLHFGAFLVILFVLILATTAELAVVLLYEAVVPQAPAVVPLWSTVVPLLWSLSTVAHWPSDALVRW